MEMTDMMMENKLENKEKD